MSASTVRISHCVHSDLHCNKTKGLAHQLVHEDRSSLGSLILVLVLSISAVRLRVGLRICLFLVLRHLFIILLVEGFQDRGGILALRRLACLRASTDHLIVPMLNNDVIWWYSNSVLNIVQTVIVEIAHDAGVLLVILGLLFLLSRLFGLLFFLGLLLALAFLAGGLAGRRRGIGLFALLVLLRSLGFVDSRAPPRCHVAFFVAVSSQSALSMPCRTFGASLLHCRENERVELREVFGSSLPFLQCFLVGRSSGPCCTNSLGRFQGSPPPTLACCPGRGSSRR